MATPVTNQSTTFVTAADIAGATTAEGLAGVINTAIGGIHERVSALEERGEILERSLVVQNLTFFFAPFGCHTKQ